MNKTKITQLVAKAVHSKIELDKTSYTKGEVERLIKDDRIRIRISIANELRKIALISKK